MYRLSIMTHGNTRVGPRFKDPYTTNLYCLFWRRRYETLSVDYQTSVSPCVRCSSYKRVHSRDIFQSFVRCLYDF